jgi:hypothetical protein
MGRRARAVLAVALAVVGVVVIAAVAGAVAGRSVADSDAASATSAAGIAAAAHNEADLAAAAAASAEAAARNSTAGICYTVEGGRVARVAPPIAEPGGFTCPAGPWRWTPVEPQPAPSGSGTIGGLLWRVTGLSRYVEQALKRSEIVSNALGPRLAVVTHPRFC